MAPDWSGRSDGRVRRRACRFGSDRIDDRIEVDPMNGDVDRITGTGFGAAQRSRGRERRDRFDPNGAAAGPGQAAW